MSTTKPSPIDQSRRLKGIVLARAHSARTICTPAKASTTGAHQAERPSSQ